MREIYELGMVLCACTLGALEDNTLGPGVQVELNYTARDPDTNEGERERGSRQRGEVKSEEGWEERDSA